MGGSRFGPGHAGVKPTEAGPRAARKLGWKWASLKARIGPQKIWNWLSPRAKLGLGQGPIEAIIIKNKIIILFDI